MKDLTDPRWIKFKGCLFLFVGLLASVLLILEVLTLKNAALLIIAIWCFCRAYYFAFYVVEKNVDPRFSIFRTVLNDEVSLCEAQTLNS